MITIMQSIAGLAAFRALLFYWKILRRVVQVFAWCLKKTMRIGGTEGLWPAPFWVPKPY